MHRLNSKPLPFCPCPCSLDERHLTVMQRKGKLTLSHRPSNSFPSVPSLFYHLLMALLLYYIVVRCSLLANIFNEQHWNLVNIVFMVAKLGNMFWQPIFVREAKMFLTRGENIVLFPSSKISCFRNICFPCALTGKHLPSKRCSENVFQVNQSLLEPFACFFVLTDGNHYKTRPYTIASFFYH